jgi:hypothetical protein
VVASSDVLLALIGREWLTITDVDGQRRLDDQRDFVRLKIEVALERDVRIVPILVDGAGMPRADELPAGAAGLVRRQALEIDLVDARTEPEPLQLAAAEQVGPLGVTIDTPAKVAETNSSGRSAAPNAAASEG